MNEILIQTEFVTLGQFLKISGLILTGGEAKYFLQENSVKVNDLDEKRRGKKLFPGDFVEINNEKYLIVHK